MSNLNKEMEYNKFFHSLKKDPSEQGYIKGSMFIDIAREYDENIPRYGKYIELRREDRLSTSRRDYFKDILKLFSLDVQYLIMDECQNITLG